MAAELAAVLSGTGLEPGRVFREITETEILHDPVAAREVLVAVTALGVRPAIDDFGTGHASLSRLTDMPAHVVSRLRSSTAGAFEGRTT